MATGTGKYEHQFFSVHPVYQKPIAFNVQFAVAFLVAFGLVVPVLGDEKLLVFCHELLDGFCQFFCLVMLFEEGLSIALELRGSGDTTKHRSGLPSAHQQTRTSPPARFLLRSVRERWQGFRDAG